MPGYVDLRRTYSWFQLVTSTFVTLLHDLHIIYPYIQNLIKDLSKFFQEDLKATGL